MPPPASTPPLGRTASAVAVIAAVYGYFLIFAQFSFVELLRATGAGLPVERAALGLMAGAGIASGFPTAWRGILRGTVKRALVLAAVSAAAAPFARHPALLLAVAAATGAALGAATVAVAGLVRGWCNMVWAGVGTGLGYALCNLPFVFHQAPATQAWIGAGFAAAGSLFVPKSAEWQYPARPAPLIPPWAAVASFAALVWLDSAAFFIIQHVAETKAATWGGLWVWRNSAIHLAAAVLGGLWLSRGGARALPPVAWALLAVAALAANAAATLPLAGWLYPAGVSLYSAALVVWPAWFCGAANARQAAYHAAWLFAIGGWVASANGIGMAGTLREVPPAFVLAAGVAVIWAALFSAKGKRLAAIGPALVLAAVLLGNSVNRTTPAATAAERGKQIYISEGCIHCHSQFIRPGAPDEPLWGRSENTRDARSTSPVLIGNRRQGPDLATVGARRSAAWLREHFIDPRALVPRSNMPAYPHLFRDSRGDDLIAYLQQLARTAPAPTVPDTQSWSPHPTGDPNPARARTDFAQWCAACHGPGGRGDGPLASNLQKRPANLADGPFLWTRDGPQLAVNTARVIKFGIPGTDMPGHETLDDSRLADLRDYVLSLRHAGQKGPPPPAPATSPP